MVPRFAGRRAEKAVRVNLKTPGDEAIPSRQSVQVHQPDKEAVSWNTSFVPDDFLPSDLR